MRDSGEFGKGKLAMFVPVLVLLSLAWAGCLPAVAQNPSSGNTPAQPQQQQNQQDNSIPDAPSAVQPPAAQEPPPPEAPKPETKKPVERDPWTNQPINQTPPGESQNGNDSASAGSNTPPPPMPPVKTLPPGSTTKQNSNGQDQLLTFVVRSNFVQVPVSVKDKHGRPVEDLHAADFTVKENGIPQKLSFFSSDPFALSVAVILDLGMPDVAVQQVNKTLPALLGAFAPYDEISLYTYSSTVSQVSDFTGSTRKLEALVSQMKIQRGTENGPPVLGGPLGQNGPVINNIPVGTGTEAIYTPEKQSHVLNDAILQAALDLGKRPRDRRKIIFIISDGREQGSKASYRDVLRLLLSREIEVKAVGVEGASIPVVRKLEQLHIPDQGRSDILPKYVRATGGGEVYSELSAKMLEDVYSEAMMEARNQYTLGYTPLPPKAPVRSAYREIEVVVHRPGLKVQAKDGYYPVLSATR
jgi:VWFA-related protein